MLQSVPDDLALRRSQEDLTPRRVLQSAPERLVLRRLPQEIPDALLL